MEELKDHVSNQNTWVRALFMLLFGLVFWLCQFVLLVVAVFQFLFLLFSGEKNQQLNKFCGAFSRYLGQVSAYLTQASELRPYPFAAWPEDRPAEPVADDDGAARRNENESATVSDSVADEAEE